MLNYPYDELPRHVVDALGVKTSYYMAGKPNGRPVVLLHGMSTSADSFRETMHELADDHWLIAPDIPGFGYSDNTKPYTIPHLVEWLASFQEALHLPQMAVSGHSFGGVLAIAFAAWYPEVATRLLLLAPAILSAGNYPRWLKKAGIGLGLIDLGTLISQSSLMVNRQIRVPFHAPEAQDESVWDRRLRDYELARASASVLKATALSNLQPLLQDIDHPVCLVWGEDDPVVPESDADRLAQMMENVEMHKFANCGHLPMLERPTQFLAVAREFLAAS